MSESVRHGDFSPAGSGTPFEPGDRPPPADWDGDHVRATSEVWDQQGIDPAALDEAELIDEIASLHRTRLDTLRHGPDHALANHLRRTAELETEYLARHPGREVDAGRLTGHG